MKFFLAFFLSTLALPVFAQKAGHSKHHHIGLGLSYFFFLNDLKEEFNNTHGFSLSYEYSFERHERKPTLGLRVEYYKPEKNGFENERYQISPEFSMLVYNDYFPLGASMSFEGTYWKQTRTILQKETFHEDFLFGMSVGLYTKTQINSWSHVKYSLHFHLEQFGFATPFFTLGIQYVWDI